jgi:transposase InsO family protein
MLAIILADSEECATTSIVADLETLLRNHLGQVVSVDFFTVPTVRLRVLFVFLLIEHRRREVLHFNVTDHPTSEWIEQQIVEAFADREAHDIRSGIGTAFMEMKCAADWSRLALRRSSRRLKSPWQNAYVERLIGSIRRECLNHFIVLNARHLKRTLAAYFRYYHRSRPHLALEKQCPIERQIMKQA